MSKLPVSIRSFAIVETSWCMRQPVEWCAVILLLDTFKEIKIGVAYKINGKEFCCFPSSLEKLADVEVEYEVFDGWMMPTTDIRDFKSLPTNAKIYLKRIEELLGIPIKYIGVGAERDAMIHIE